jgi:hypothetical protein
VIDGLARSYANVLDDRRGFGCERGFHFHCFDNDERLAGLDYVADLDQHPQDLAGHRCEDLRRRKSTRAAA